jgi:pyruvate kinase
MTHFDILPAQKSKIVAAIGPASEPPEMLERLVGTAEDLQAEVA